MSQTIYLDTSVICYLTDPPSPNPITRACQQLTRLWRETRYVQDMTYVSESVKQDIQSGDPQLAISRLELISPLTRYPSRAKVKSIAELLIAGGGLKANAMGPAMHIACAAYHRVEILLTWNCVDIANAAKLPLLRMLAGAQELHLPELVTPFELMENSHEDF